MHPCVARQLHPATATLGQTQKQIKKGPLARPFTLAELVVPGMRRGCARRGNSPAVPGEPARWSDSLFLQLVPLAGVNHIGRIQRFFVELNFDYLSGFIDDECCPPHHFGLRIPDAIVPGNIAAQVAQHWEVGAQLIRPGFIREKPIHGDTQDLGVGRFQLLQILLEALRFLASTRRKRKDIKRQSHVLLTLEVMEGNILPILIFQGEIGRHISDFDGRHR
jgi:hypothetical protein